MSDKQQHSGKIIAIEHYKLKKDLKTIERSESALTYLISKGVVIPHSLLQTFNEMSKVIRQKIKKYEKNDI
ncbi:MAG: hypothetical protein CXT73_07060 [Methanobacteriota archaeon]|jgi:hypothetical protein|nr:MAG: hypothetical protein CXT73_07060 [Euryarchaeota archaeon]